MKTVVTEKPMYFECDCGERFILGVWKLQQENSLMVVRFLNNNQQFHCCPFCGGRMSSKDMVMQHGPS